MTSDSFSRRAFSIAAGSLAAGVGAVSARAGTGDDQPASGESLGISHSNEAIHQEVVFRASPARVYRALTDPHQFDQIVLLSGAIAAMSLANAPARISPEPGGRFSIFGGYITGRHVELSPSVRIIQAWRAGSWAPHVYSIARFELAEHAGATLLSFDQTGFPNDEAVSLATGWREHYWAPLAKVLA
jgi:uncharacterized protein YndB with AHSA1/START domain